jgi:hypothetical protein
MVLPCDSSNSGLWHSCAVGADVIDDGVTYTTACKTQTSRIHPALPCPAFSNPQTALPCIPALCTGTAVMAALCFVV